MKKRAIAQTKESLKIVPYWVMKKPSEPSRIGSATSYIAFVPQLLSRIYPSIHILNAIKPIEITKAENAIRLAVVLEIKIEKKRMDAGIAPSAPNFIA